MALSESVEFNTSPLKLGTTNVAIIWGTGVPDGDSAPQDAALKGSLYLQTNATDDESPLWIKVDEDSSNSDWVQVWVDKQEDAQSFEAAITLDADNKFCFRDTGIFAYSPADGDLRLEADGHVYIGDGTNQADFAADGELTLEGTAQVTKRLPLPIITGGGTTTVSMIGNAPSIDFNADGETFYASFIVPYEWDGVSDLYYDAMVLNEIAETDGDDVSITLTVAGWADGEAATAVGQTVAILQDLTGGDEAINVVNLCSGTIDYNEATYPMTAGDVVHIKGVVNLAGANECTGPLHITSHVIRYAASRLGQAT